VVDVVFAEAGLAKVESAVGARAADPKRRAKVRLEKRLSTE